MEKSIKEQDRKQDQTEHVGRLQDSHRVGIPPEYVFSQSEFSHRVSILTE